MREAAEAKTRVIQSADGARKCYLCAQPTTFVIVKEFGTMFEAVPVARRPSYDFFCCQDCMAQHLPEVIWGPPPPERQKAHPAEGAPSMELTINPEGFLGSF